MSSVPSKAVLVDMYRRMTLIKQNDERFRATIMAGKIVAPYYSPRGQEVIPSAVSVNLRDTDYICTIYRGIHDMLAKGVPLKQLWAEIAGKVTGTCKGKGGPMHITHPASGVMVTTGIVGSSMPIANGLALAAQIRGEDRVAVAYFGDGASNIGAFHESLNMASVWKLPVVFVCQNNRYGEHTQYEVATSVDADLRPRRGLPDAGRDRRRQRPARDVCRREGGRRSRACGRRSDADRGHDFPLPWSRVRRHGRLHGQGREEGAGWPGTRCPRSARG